MGIEAEEFAALYERTYPGAYRTAFAITGSRASAEDSTQQAYCDAFTRRRSFRGDGSPEAWLMKIVVNRAIDELRRRQRAGGRVPIELDGLVAEPDHSRPDPDLLEGIAGLQPRHRAAVVLRYYHGYPVKAIGEMLSTSPNGASMLLARALEALRSALLGLTEVTPLVPADLARRGVNDERR